jgi:hypothetical protein
MLTRCSQHSSRCVQTSNGRLCGSEWEKNSGVGKVACRPCDVNNYYDVIEFISYLPGVQKSVCHASDTHLPLRFFAFVSYFLFFRVNLV